MIVLDVPMPGRCRECPCVYRIMTGPLEGLLMCCAMEWKDVAEDQKRSTAAYLVKDENVRPIECLIRMGVAR